MSKNWVSGICVVSSSDKIDWDEAWDDKEEDCADSEEDMGIDGFLKPSLDLSCEDGNWVGICDCCKKYSKIVEF